MDQPNTLLSEEEQKKVQDAIAILSNLQSQPRPRSLSQPEPGPLRPQSDDNARSISSGSSRPGPSGTAQPNGTSLAQGTGLFLGRSAGAHGAWQRFDRAYRNAVTSLRRSRGVPLDNCDGLELEQQRNFCGKRSSSAGLLPSKKAKTSCWTQKFVCLAYVDDDRVPTTNAAREELKLAGLGEKKIVVEDVDCSTSIFHSILFKYFPQLQGCGGFELLKCVPCTRDLEVITSPTCNSPRLLRNRIRSGRIYIRPIQNNLSLEVAEELVETEEMSEFCKKCDDLILVKNLRSHLVTCKGDTYRDSDSSVSGGDCEVIAQSSIEETEQEMVNAALNASVQVDQSEYQSECVCSHDGRYASIEDFVKEIASLPSEETFMMRVRRDHILEDCLVAVERKAYSPSVTFEVEFLGESGVDGGGPKRECWRLLAINIKQRMCVGQNGHYVLNHDIVGLQCGKFKAVGELMAVSLAQGGSGFPFFSNCMFQYLCGVSLRSIPVDLDEVPDYDVKMLLEKISNASSKESLCEVLMEATDVVVNAGFSKPLSNVSLEDKKEIVQGIAIHYTLLQSVAEMDQLIEGLNTSPYRIVDEMRRQSDIFLKVFTTQGIVQLTAEKLERLFNCIQFSEEGSSQRSMEECTYMMFSRLLNECERADTDETGGDVCTLEEVLIFFTGADKIPLLGFPNSLSMAFDREIAYPTASTCALLLILPIKYDDYNSFKQKCVYAFKNHGGFGNL